MDVVNNTGRGGRLLIAAIAAVAMVPLLATVETVDDFYGMDTTSASAQTFWNVSGHPIVTNTTTEATLSGAETIDARAYGEGAGEIDAFDSRYRTRGDSNMIAEFRSDRPKGLIINFR